MPFRGYFTFGDPRGPLFASRGAKWPTCPAWRFRLGSETATGSWGFLKTTGILFEHVQGNADYSLWEPIADAPACFTKCELSRGWIPIVSLVKWRIRINCGCPGAPWEISKTLTPGRSANVDLTLGKLHTPGDQGNGEAGVVTLYQVQFDEENPPDGWPPWA